MSVFENLLVAAAFAAGRPEAACYDHCVDVLTRTGLLAKANRPAGALTLLERKRLELARALANPGRGCCCSTRSPAASPSMSAAT